MDKTILYVNLALAAITILQSLFLLFFVPDRRMKIIGTVTLINMAVLGFMTVQSLMTVETLLSDREFVTVLFLTIQIILWTLLAISRDAFGVTPKAVIKKAVSRRE